MTAEQQNSSFPKISGFVICLNEKGKIEACLKSLSFCDEIVVVDSGSTDGTIQIAEQLAHKVVFNAWKGFVQQKQFGLDQCSHDWVLNVDADEIVTPELADEIRRSVLTADAKAINGFELQRTVYFQGKFWRKGGWYPEYRLRLVRKSKTRWGGRNPHEKPITEPQHARLRGELLHYTYENFSAQIRSLNSFTSTSAEELYREGARSSMFKVIFNPLARFLKFYFLRKGYREGKFGFIVAVIEGFNVFMKYVKLLELERERREKP